ncbi:MAG TPA: hypothetical protein VE972_06270 [Conexibacter sp.]|nr:hypothetical protein [Conexibacter sp.]
MRPRSWLLAALILALFSPAALAADPAPQYFDLPTGFTAGAGVAAAPDGSVWFVANPVATPQPSLGRLIPAQASPGTTNGVATFPTPTQTGTSCCANGTRSVAFDAANNRVWFVQNDGIVGFANAAAVSPGTSAGMTDKLLSTPIPGGHPDYHPVLWDIAVGPGGRAWFSEEGDYNLAPYPDDRIASIDASLSVTESDNIALQNHRVTLDPARYPAQPQGITVDAAGKPWFAEANAGSPGYRIATANGLGYDEYLLAPCSGSPCSGSNTGTGPTDVAVAKDGSIWFTNQLKNEVGRLDAAGHTFTNYSLPAIDPGLAGGQARAISAAPDGTLWVVEYGGFSSPNANAIVKLVPSQPQPTAKVFHLGAGRYPLGVAPDTKGNVWFTVATDVAPTLIGRLAGVVAAAGGGGGGGGGGGKVVKPSSVGAAKIGTPSTEGTSLSVNQICVGPPADRCSLVYLISQHEYVTGFSGSTASALASIAAKKGRRKPKPVILGRKTVTLRGGQHKQVTIKLNAKGRKLLKHAKHGKLTLYFTATQQGAKGKPPKRVKQAKVTFKLPPKHRR